MSGNNEWNSEKTFVEFIKRLSVPFNDLGLLNRALTHRSYVNEHTGTITDNERLEFLGDAVLDFVVGAWLYNHFPEKKEGELTRIRSSLVRTEQLAKFAREIKLGENIKLGRGEILAGGRDRDILLCSAFEALIGAIFLENNIIVVQEFMERFLQNNVGEFMFQSDQQDPKSKLQEWSQANKLGIPIYDTVTIKGPEHERTFEVRVNIDGKEVGAGFGHNKQQASKEAALKALSKINKR
jgi:ribonuclease III